MNVDLSVPESLAHLGELAVAREQIVVAVDDAEAQIDLGYGAILDVPRGAFEQPTELTVVAVDLRFNDYLEDPPASKAYVVSTNEHVVLTTAVFLELPAFAKASRIVQFTDDGWGGMAVGPGEQIRIPIDHFSDSVNLAIETPPATARFITPDPPRVGAAGGVLANCIFTLGATLTDQFITDEMEAWYAGRLGQLEREDLNEFFREYAFGICVRALVNVESRGGPDVSVECVGSKIGETVTLGEAVAQCRRSKEEPDQAAETSASAQPDSNSDATASEVAEVPGAAPWLAVGDTWEGTLEFAEELTTFKKEETFIHVTRLNESMFDVVAYLDFGNYWERFDCDFDWVMTFEGTGIDAADGLHIEVTGSQDSLRDDDCPDNDGPAHVSGSAELLLTDEGLGFSGTIEGGWWSAHIE